MKKQFLNSELWTLSTLGAFQRAYCYNANSTEIQRTEFKRELKKHIDQNLLEAYKLEVSEAKHIENIYSVQDFTKNYTDLFNEGCLNFGISQKLFNLYLKYLWVIGEINRPPHFPVDRIIQERLKIKQIENWTQFKNEDPYWLVINHAKKELENQVLKLPNEAYQSVADLELYLFNRR